MARFQLTSPWPIQRGLTVPGGTEIEIRDGVAKVVPVPADAWSNPESNSYTGIDLPLPLPLTTKALDQQALDAMVAWYGPLEQTHLLHFTPGLITRKAVP